MKKILFAWIEQIIEFDTDEERQSFIKNTKGLKVVELFEQEKIQPSCQKTLQQQQNEMKGKCNFQLVLQEKY